MISKHLQNVLFLTAIAFRPLLFIGCSEKGPRRYAISGTIKYRGQLVPIGNVSFEPNLAKKIVGLRLVR